MKALVFHGDNDLKLDEVNVPTLEPDEELIRVAAVGICGSDVHGYLGKTGRRTPPMIMGHEFSGIRENGENVAVFPYKACGECSCCLEGAAASCPNKIMFGVFAENGGMAEFVAVRRNQLFKLPQGASPIHAAMAEPLSVAFHAVAKADVNSVQRVAIVGAGAIGLLCLVLAKQLGAKHLSVLDIDRSRLELAKKIGADEIFQSDREALPEMTFDTVVEAVGLSATVSQALKLVRRGGALILVGMSQKEIPLDMFDLISREIVIKGSFQYTRQEFESVVNMLPALKEQLDSLISHKVGLSQGVEMFQRLAAGETGMTKVVLVPTSGAEPKEGQA